MAPNKNIKLSKLIQKTVKYILEDLSLQEVHSEYKTLYHIGPRPASPKPFKGGKRFGGAGAWKRYYHNKPIKNGVFMSDDWEGVWMNHGISGNIYAYKIPMAAIEEAGGLQEWDMAREILFPKEVWEKYNLSKTLLGKSLFKDQAKDLLIKKGKYSRTSFAASPTHFTKAEKLSSRNGRVQRKLDKFLALEPSKQKEVLTFLTDDEKLSMLEEISMLLKKKGKAAKELVAFRKKFEDYREKAIYSNSFDRKYKDMGNHLRILKLGWESLYKYEDKMPDTKKIIEDSLAHR